MTLLRAVAVAAGITGLALLGASCGGSPGPRVPQVASARAASRAPVSRALAFARCMRAHGVPTFPDPDSQGDFPAFRGGQSKQVSVAANEACKQLRPGGGSATPQQQRQKLTFAFEVARCLRAHGYPSFPDPSPTQGTRIPPGIDTESPSFQAAELSCEAAARVRLGLP